MRERRMSRKSLQCKERGVKGKAILLIVIVIAIMVVNMIMPLRKVYAAAKLQSKPGATSLTGISVNDFFTLIRQMEASGGTLGLTATFDSTKWTQNNTANGVDIHMAKNTEWGTAAMLSASQYGLAPSGTSSASTTGNNTGIFQMADGTYEYVAGIYNTTYSTSLEYMGKIKSADVRYYDLYTSEVNSSAYKKGDATYETRIWKGATTSSFVNRNWPVLRRSYSAMFGYIPYVCNDNSTDGSRAVMILGAGL